MILMKHRVNNKNYSLQKILQKFTVLQKIFGSLEFTAADPETF